MDGKFTVTEAVEVINLAPNMEEARAVPAEAGDVEVLQESPAEGEAVA